MSDKEKAVVKKLGLAQAAFYGLIFSVTVGLNNILRGDPRTMHWLHSPIPESILWPLGFLLGGPLLFVAVAVLINLGLRGLVWVISRQ